MRIEAISDQKRVARGEAWLRARYWLKARDGIHNGAWKCLTIAGPAPFEEIKCIRSLMPNAEITCVDINRENAARALDAGADFAMCGDIAEFSEVPLSSGNFKYIPPAPLRDKKFDVVNLDLTGAASDWLKRLVNTYWLEALTTRGVMMVTFSYGREVVEKLDEEWQRETGDYRNKQYKLVDHGSQLENIPAKLAARLWYVFRSRTQNIEYCFQYKGKRMPMVSCLLVKRHKAMPPAKFVPLTSQDFELAVTAENIGDIYACPPERIAHLRRSLAARKAVHTKEIRSEVQPDGGRNGSATEEDDAGRYHNAAADEAGGPDPAA